MSRALLHRIGHLVWFRELAPGGWWFRPVAEHVAHYLNHICPRPGSDSPPSVGSTPVSAPPVPTA
ncbi:hypothetical protein BU204_11630 [Actinophytocola xanthii]|uniref:Uncharacterized protein n=1 Tax=Actinophytocola xanthii TaxID=1912961 RepID=A0A1Q8CSR9_9PSEU|nr:hypothetical protein BU204_11630 [Actinophytocola xanthii]